MKEIIKKQLLHASGFVKRKKRKDEGYFTTFLVQCSAVDSVLFGERGVSLFNQSLYHGNTCTHLCLCMQVSNHLNYVAAGQKAFNFVDTGRELWLMFTSNVKIGKKL